MEQSEQMDEVTKENSLALGIDFGNSKISVAAWDSKKKIPVIVKDKEASQFKATINFYGSRPSNQDANSNSGPGGVVSPKDYQIQNDNINEEAQENKDSNQIDNNINNSGPSIGVDFHPGDNLETYVYSIKKIIGQKNDNPKITEIKDSLGYNIIFDKNKDLFFSMNEEHYTLDIIASHFFKKAKEMAEKQFNKEVGSLTVSVPHGFNNNQKKAIRAAANNAGIQNVFIINDPLSTAIYYASRNKILKTEFFLIIDYGSSKLDVTILSINKKNSIKILFSGGDSYLGGDELNKELIRDALDNFKQDGGSDIEKEPSKYFLLKQGIEKIKIKLGFSPKAEISIPKLDGNVDFHYSMKREEFNDLNRDVYTKIIGIIEKVVEESKIPPEKISHVILQGDTMKVTELSNKLISKYQDKDVITDLFNSVALGSAIFTAGKIGFLENEKFNRFKIYDITPLSLGIRTEGELMSVILPRGTRIPTKACKTFITTQDNQANIKFEIYEGERKLIKDNTRLERIMLKGLPQKNKGEVKVEVCFEIDEESNLHVTAKETTSNILEECDVIINESLTQNDIKNNIEEAQKCEEDDTNEKERIQSMLKLNDKIFEYNHLYEGNEDILRELEAFRNWIKHSSSVPKEEYEKKLTELNETMNKDKNDNKKSKKLTGNNQTHGNKKPANIKQEEEKNPENK